MNADAAVRRALRIPILIVLVGAIIAVPLARRGNGEAALAVLVAATLVASVTWVVLAVRRAHSREAR